MSLWSPIHRVKQDELHVGDVRTAVDETDSLHKRRPMDDVRTMNMYQCRLFGRRSRSTLQNTSTLLSLYLISGAGSNEAFLER